MVAFYADHVDVAVVRQKLFDDLAHEHSHLDGLLSQRELISDRDLVVIRTGALVAQEGDVQAGEVGGVLLVREQGVDDLLDALLHDVP